MSDSGSSVDASLSRLMAGRTRDSTVWKFFEYDASTGKSACMVQSEGNECVLLNCLVRIPAIWQHICDVSIKIKTDEEYTGSRV